MDRESTEPREPVPGPGGSKLAPEGNADARLFVPGDQEEKGERRDPEEPEDRAGATDEDD